MTRELRDSRDDQAYSRSNSYSRSIEMAMPGSETHG